MLAVGCTGKACFSVKMVLQEIFKPCKYFLAKLARSCITSLASLALKMKLFLQDIKNFASFLQEKCKIIFLRFGSNLARKLSYIFSCKNLAKFLYLARKDSFLVQVLQDLMQDLASLARKYLHISCRTFLLDSALDDRAKFLRF